MITIFKKKKLNNHRCFVWIIKRTYIKSWTSVVEKASWAIGGVWGAFWFQVALLVMEMVVIDIKDEVVLIVLSWSCFGEYHAWGGWRWCIIPATPCQPHVPASSRTPERWRLGIQLSPDLLHETRDVTNDIRFDTSWFKKNYKIMKFFKPCCSEAPPW